MDEDYLHSRGWQRLPDGRFGLSVSYSNILALCLKEAVEWQRQTDEALRLALEAVPLEPFVQRAVGFSIAGTVTSK